MENYNEKTEAALIEMVRQKEESDRRLLSYEIVIMVISGIFLASMFVIASMIQMQDWMRFVLIGVGLVQFVIAALFAVRIEQTAGYYECAECGHRYVPKYSSVNLAMHMGRTRYMKCPECGKKSWQKKVISKE